MSVVSHKVLKSVRYKRSEYYPKSLNTWIFEILFAQNENVSSAHASEVCTLLDNIH